MFCILLTLKTAYFWHYWKNIFKKPTYLIYHSIKSPEFKSHRMDLIGHNIYFKYMLSCVFTKTKQTWVSSKNVLQKSKLLIHTTSKQNLLKHISYILTESPCKSVQVIQFFESCYGTSTDNIPAIWDKRFSIVRNHMGTQFSTSELLRMYFFFMK